MKPVSRAYFKDLAKLTRALFRDINQQIVSQIPRWTREETELNASDAIDEELPFLIEQLKQQYSAPQILFEYQDIARRAEARTDTQSEAQTRRQLRNLGIDIFRESPQLDRLSQRFVGRNVALITSIPQQALTNVEQVIGDGVQSGTRARDLARQITGLVEGSELSKTRNRAALIARNETLTHSAQLSRARQRSNGITRFIWRTVGDGRVRDLHEDRDGVEYSWADGAGAEDTYPGDGVQCRCSSEPVL
jgi:SPP1 gp7 family putative phage head morphogenesis protein